MTYNSLHEIKERKKVLKELMSATKVEFVNRVTTTGQDVKSNAVKWAIPAVMTGIVGYIGKKYLDKTDIFEKKDEAPAKVEKSSNTKEMLESVKVMFPDLGEIADKYMPSQ